MSQQSTEPKPVLAIGRFRDITLSVESQLKPEFFFPAMVDLAHYSPEAVRTVLIALNPSPACVLAGGGVTEEIQHEIKAVLDEFNGNGNSVKFMSVPIGIREKVGPERHVAWIKQNLTRVVNGEKQEDA